MEEGYPAEWFVALSEDDEKELCCVVCDQIACAAMSASCGCCILCERCMDKVTKDKGICPICQKAITEVVASHKDRRKISRLMVYCDNKENGCDWKGRLEERLDKDFKTKHLCPFHQIPCIHCLALVKRNEMEDHVTKDCPERQVICENCENKIKWSETKVHNQKTCPKAKLACVNNCGDVLLRDQLDAHIVKCPLQLVDCPYRNKCCPLRDGKIIQKNFETHKNDIALHFPGAIKRIEKLEAIILELAAKKEEKKEKKEMEGIENDDVGRLTHSLTVPNIRMIFPGTYRPSVPIASLQHKWGVYLEKDKSGFQLGFKIWLHEGGPVPISAKANLYLLHPLTGRSLKHVPFDATWEKSDGQGPSFTITALQKLGVYDGKNDRISFRIDWHIVA